MSKMTPTPHGTHSDTCLIKFRNEVLCAGQLEHIECGRVLVKGWQAFIVICLLAGGLSYLQQAYWLRYGGHLFGSWCERPNAGRTYTGERRRSSHMGKNRGLIADSWLAIIMSPKNAFGEPIIAQPRHVSVHHQLGNLLHSMRYIHSDSKVCCRIASSKLTGKIKSHAHAHKLLAAAQLIWRPRVCRHRPVKYGPSLVLWSMS